MRNFQRLVQGLDVSALVHELARQGTLWNENTLRTTHPESPHTQVDDIWLRFDDLEPYKASGGEDVKKVIDGHESIFWPSWYKLPAAQKIVHDLMYAVKGVRLGRVLITRMAPGAVIAPHVDGGEHAAYYDRYHVTLQNGPGSLFHCGDEQVNMKAGEVWWFDNSVEHSVVNNSADDRLTLIVDIRTVR